MPTTRAELHYFRSITAILEAIQESRDVDAVIEAVSNATLNIFDCDRVFLLYPCDPESPTFQVPYEATRPEYPGALALKLDLPMTDENRSLFAACLETNDPIVIQPEDMARVRDEVPDFHETAFVMPKTAMVMAIYPKVGKPWIFGLQQCSHVRQWEEHEQQMFVDIAQRLTDALSSHLLLQGIKDSENKYRHLVESLGRDYYLYSHDCDGVFTYLSPSFATMLGYDPAESLQHFDSFLTDNVINSKVGEHTDIALRGEMPPPYLIEVRHNDGTPVQLELTEAPVFDESGKVIGVEGIAHDVTTINKANEELRLVASVFNNTDEGIVITDANSRIQRVNRAFCNITGYDEQEIIGFTPRRFKSGRHDRGFYSALWDAILSEGVWQGEIWNRRKNGEVFPSWQTISAVRNEKGEVEQYISIFSDITEKKVSEERIRTLAYNDALTNLPNRQLFIERMQRAIVRAQRKNDMVALLYLDLDRFKHINDSLGHPVGDVLIQQVADRLQRCVRAEDTVARLGGDEFTLIIEEVSDSNQVVRVANKILGSFVDPFMIEGNSLHATASIGISLYPEHGKDVDELVKYADVSMYHAKERGGNQYGFYLPEMTTRAEEWVQLEGELSQALERGQLELYYQPQVNSRSGELFGAEALLRWNHPDKGVISPLKFIPMAEATGMINAFGEWVISEACRQLRSWLANGLMLKSVAVNVSGHQLQNDGLVEFIEQQLKLHELEPSQLELEVTESYLMGHSSTQDRILADLKHLGVRIAIDDFGTGYSSLSRLKYLPLTKLKIDRSFVRDIVQDSNDEAIVMAVAALSNSLQLEVIAEGVEESAQVEKLQQHGCDQIQGYFYSPPLPVADFVSWAAQHRERHTPHQHPA